MGTSNLGQLKNRGTKNPPEPGKNPLPNHHNTRAQNNQTNRCIVYVDGSCSFNGYSNATAGIGIWFAEKHPLNTYKSLKEDRITNIPAETAAAIEACKICLRHDIYRIKIRTDSKYLISCMTEHLQKWKSNGWLNARHQPVVNQKLLKELDQLTKEIDVQWEHTPGHQGIYGNERADELAKLGSRIDETKSKRPISNHNIRKKLDN